MVTRVLRSVDDVDALARFIGARDKFPLTVTITQGDKRGDRQNRLAQRWYTDIARQLGDETHEEVRAGCKVALGVPILREENEAFRQSWDATIGHLNHEAKLNFVRIMDIPVTRLMTVKQMTAFMDAMQRYWLSIGVRLTDPDALKYEEDFA